MVGEEKRYMMLFNGIHIFANIRFELMGSIHHHQIMEVPFDLGDMYDVFLSRVYKY